MPQVVAYQRSIRVATQATAEYEVQKLALLLLKLLLYIHEGQFEIG